MRDDKYLIKVSKFLALVLRHKPEEANISLDKCGWADVRSLLKGINDKYGPLTLSELEYIVETDDKGRYAFDKYHTKIRAVQGHSFSVDLELEERKPPHILYHGTAGKSISSILNSRAILPMSRQYVHLSDNTDTAYLVGERHSMHDVQICVIDAQKMQDEGYKFYQSENGVWLTEKVPYEYFFVIPVTKENYSEKINQCLKDLGKVLA